MKETTDRSSMSFALLETQDEKKARDARKYLAREAIKDASLLDEIILRFNQTSSTNMRRELCTLIGDIARNAKSSNTLTTTEPCVAWLQSQVTNTDGPIRRRAIAALGRIGNAPARRTLIAEWKQNQDPADRRALAIALGRIGGAEVSSLLANAIDTGNDALFSKRLSDARLKVQRNATRETSTTISAHRALPPNTSVLLHVRAGIEELLIRELPANIDKREVGPGRVLCRMEGPLEPLFKARTFLSLGFPLPPESISNDKTLPYAIARAFTSKTSRAILEAITQGPIRYRIHWSDGGKQRANTANVVSAIARMWPTPVNDPTDAPWQLGISVRKHENTKRVHVELWPKALPDPRFAYRKSVLPASSNPTIAAALVYLASIEKNDVVWDPFAGTATELIERAIAGPYKHLYGTDTDPNALANARENLKAANVQATLTLADAQNYSLPEPPTLILTNPPFGRRMPVEGGIKSLLATVLTNATRQMKIKGRISIVLPRPLSPEHLARQCNLTVARSLRIDLGGLEGTIVLFSKGEVGDGSRFLGFASQP